MDMSPHPSLPASKTQLVVSTGVHSRGCRGTVSEPNPLSALRSKWYRFNSVLRRSCFMFQFGIGTSMPSCNRWLFPAAANILLAFIPPLKSVGFPARQVINFKLKWYLLYIRLMSEIADYAEVKQWLGLLRANSTRDLYGSALPVTELLSAPKPRTFLSSTKMQGFCGQ